MVTRNSMMVTRSSRMTLNDVTDYVPSSYMIASSNNPYITLTNDVDSKSIENCSSDLQYLDMRQ